jgi:hypothetical protein
MLNYQRVYMIESYIYKHMNILKLILQMQTNHVVHHLV